MSDLDDLAEIGDQLNSRQNTRSARGARLKRWAPSRTIRPPLSAGRRAAKPITLAKLARRAMDEVDRKGGG